MRLSRDFDDRRPKRQPRTRWKVGLAQVEVDEQLIAGQRPTVLRLREERNRPGVHHVQLHVGVRRAIGGPRALSLVPTVADESDGRVEIRLLKNLPGAGVRPPNDQLQRPLIFGRPQDVFETRFDFLGRQLPHAHISPFAHVSPRWLYPAPRTSRLAPD